ncbi:ATP-binding protein [Candidatus Venteria ishoeyi]|uniref:ATPase family associated with various cellular activities (AAA) n=1 Tax=Candidatus Venteria ishoeyi TaxID=1899563 RepID=A0A1H6F484_9GAMM|nr:AAA family ATPase [Candidatus Venteria ishoeyi]SEH04902.1 ATPase family associated with various cellular activities (AAA) [Candidatus Venteria ishoeyi]
MKLSRITNAASTQQTLENLLGQHRKIKQRSLSLQLDSFLQDLRQYHQETVPAFQAYRQLRQQIITQERQALRLESFKPVPLSSFVRNRLINEVYLPIIGDNFAKQMGAAGDSKRTDLMGMLLLISPPGYGKTTLMEYLAQRLGLIFMKINCPTLGHSVVSIDPQEAPNATARQELEKLNLALEMGNNVMLYLDDIQHSNPEFLQKFISMADAQRKIEGVWRGQPKTYDLRGKRFCIAMAGNPYTESGETFKIPDMLANRADIYNLGDVLSGREQAFALSYLENALTSNQVLAPLANRDPEDVYRLIRLAQGEEVPGSEFSHAYGATELNEILAVLRKLFRVQEVLLKVNQQYIASAAQANEYRTEPPFKLQGSYRNMNKLAEKVVAVMNEEELENLITDHYQGEAQTLTSGAEENLLKLAELRGIMSSAEKQRWQTIKNQFNRRQSLGDPDQDPTQQVINQLSLLGDQLKQINQTLSTTPTADSIDSTSQAEIPAAEILQPALEGVTKQLAGIQKALQQATQKSSGTQDTVALLKHFSQALKDFKPVTLSQPEPNVQVVNQLPAGMDTAVQQLVAMIDETLLPIVHSFERKSRMDLVLWNRLKEVSETLKEVQGMSAKLLKRRSNYTP